MNKEGFETMTDEKAAQDQTSQTRMSFRDTLSNFDDNDEIQPSENGDSY